MNYNKKHAYSLSTHQFRVRHVQGVQVKRLRRAMRTHLSILHPTTKQELYHSAVYRPSANPQWVLQNSLHIIQSLRDLVIQVWDSDRNVLLIEHFVTLSALSYYGEKGTELQWEENTVIVLLNDSQFLSKHGRYPDIGPNVVLEEEEVKKPFCTVESSDTRVSYDTKTAHSLHAMYKSVVETESTVVNLRSEIGRHSQSVSQVESNKLHELKCRIKHLQCRRAKYMDSLSKEKDRLERMREQNAQHVVQRGALRKTVRERGNLLGEELDKMDWMIRYVVKSKLKLLKRQQAMLGQLNQIFHITQDEKSHKMMIFGLKIHPQDQINDKSDEEELGPALGYTAHMVSIVSSLLDIPLRFPVNPSLSLSTIRDDITAKLDEKRVLPLYIKGKDRSYFSYGVFLLHRNIAQIRHHCGLRTEEIKAPLGNLFELMTCKLRDTMSCHPPARVVSNDKIISKHRTTESFKKSHKRVRSAPIKFNVTIEEGGMEARTTYSNVPSEVSSWNSSSSLRISEGPAQTASSTEDVTVIANDKDAEDELEEGPDLIDFTDDGETEGAEEQPGPSNKTQTTLSTSDSVLTPEPSSPVSPHSSRLAWSEHQADDITKTLVQNGCPGSSPGYSSSLASTPPHSLTSTPPRSVTSTPPRSPSVSRAGGPGRSSFKSYVRGSELWGRSESGAHRTASFKSYHPNTTSSPRLEDSLNSAHTSSSDQSPGTARTSETPSSGTPRSSETPSQSYNTTPESSSSPVSSTSHSLEKSSSTMSSSSQRSTITSSPSRSEVRTVQPLQHHITKTYMALDSPIIVHTAPSPSSPYTQHHLPNQRSPQLANQRSPQHHLANQRSPRPSSSNEKVLSSRANKHILENGLDHVDIVVAPAERDLVHSVVPDLVPQEFYSDRC